MPLAAAAAVLAVTAALLGQASPTADLPPVGSNHYLDCSARSSGDGSSAAPWNDLASVNAHTFEPGDRLLLKRGTSCSGQLSLQGSGVKDHPIVLDAYGHGAAPTVRGGGTASWTGAVTLRDQEYWTLENLHVTNTDGARTSGAYRSGVLVLNDTDRHLRGITVERMEVDSVVSSMSNQYAGPRSFGGISALAIGARGGFTGLTIRGNTVSHVGRTGIVVANNAYPVAADSGVRITGNTVRHVRGDGILLLGSRGGRIDHDVSAYAAEEWPCPDCGPVSRFTASVAIWTGASDRVRIDHDEAYGTKWLGGDGEGFDVDSGATNTVVEDDYAHGNGGGGILFCGSVNAVARFNILQDNGKSAIAFIGTAPARSTSIYNNTLYASKKPGTANVRTFGGHIGSGVRFFNNVTYNSGPAAWVFPTTPWTRSNTATGTRGYHEPRSRGDVHRDPHLRKPGSGRIGLSSLGGYRPAKHTSEAYGRPIPRDATRDFFGRRIDPKHPPRGAAG